MGLHCRAQASVPSDGQALRQLGRAAVLALYEELALAPKPGLVSFVDSGSHADMDARTFMRSLFALRQAFPNLAVLGAAGAGFGVLERAGIDAEARMLRATGGVNTHRGAIFTLGLLCASAGALSARGQPPSPGALRRTLLALWGAPLADRCRGAFEGRGLRTAGAEAALGFPTLFETTFPALQAALRAGQAPAQARLHALLHTMAVLDDTNLVRRGGLQGLHEARRAAAACLGGGRVDTRAAWALHREFMARRLSPGGSADLLAAACWLQRVCGAAAPTPARPSPGARSRQADRAAFQRAAP